MSRRRRWSIIIGVAWVVLALAYFLLGPVFGYQPEWGTPKKDEQLEISAIMRKGSAA